MAHETVWLEEVNSLEGVSAHWQAWRQLRDDRLEDNIYSSPEFVLAGLRAYPARPFKLLFVYRVDRGSKRLIGCAPFEVSALQPQSRLRTVNLWGTPHSYLSQPLLHRDCAAQAVAALCAWFEDAVPSVDLVALPRMGVESATWDVVRRVLEARGNRPLIRHGFLRPILRRRGSFEEYLASLSAKRRKTYRRQWRKLHRTASVEVRLHRFLASESDWATRFMQMEAAGWKGQRGSALGCCPADTKFFSELTRAYSDRADLFLSEVRVEGVAAAMSASLVEGTTMFGFKVAFDPAYGEYSPGLLNAVQEVRLFHESQELRLAESGANAESFIGSYWRERVPVAKVLLPSSRAGRLALSSLDTAQRAKRGALLAFETLCGTRSREVA